MLTKDNMNHIEAQLSQLPEKFCNVEHRFTTGMYIRELTIPAGVMIVSMKHKTQHPFVLSKGVLYISYQGGEREVIEAPYTGITQPGAKRVIFAEKDAVLTTFHVTEETDVKKICDEILEPNRNPLLKDREGQHLKSLPVR